ncbi:hypothetical protein ACXGQW_11120 [Wenyingzhuangia sp. IMCC45533]
MKKQKKKYTMLLTKNVYLALCTVFLTIPLLTSCKESSSQKIKNGFEQVGEGIKENSEHIGTKLKDEAHEAHQDIKEGYNEAKEEVKKITHD